MNELNPSHDISVLTEPYNFNFIFNLYKISFYID